MVSYVTSNATWNRIRWYNSFVRDKDYFDLTDVGKVFDLSFDLRVKPADGATDLRLGYALDISGGSTSTYHPAPTANVWMTETKTFTITQNDVIKDGALTKRGLLNFSLVGTANNTYYFDDIIVKEQAPTLIEAGSAYITAEIIDESGVIADTYVSKSQPDTALGQSNRLLLNGGDDENIIFLTYSSKLIKGKKNIQFTIPAEDNASVKTEILLLDGYFVNEKELTYNNMPDLSNAVSLGEYTLKGGVNTIEIDDAVAKIHGNYFTVVFKANDSVEFVLYNNFEDYKLGTDLKTTSNNVTDPDNSSYSYYYGHLPNMTTGIARSGGATSGIGNVLIDPSNAGNQIVSVIMNKSAGYNGRIKFFNSISDGVLTADSPLVGQTLRFTVRAKGADEYTINNAGYSMASSMLSCGSAPLKDKNNVEVKSDSIILNDEWQSFTVDYTVRAEDIKVDTTASGNPAWGYPMFTVDFKSVAGDQSMTYFIDDVTVVKLNSDGTVSRLDMASSEGTGETIGLRARGVKDPVADTYISEVNKDGVFGLENSVYIDSKRTYLVTFKTDEFEKSSKTYLDLPLSGDGSQEISVYYLDGFVVDEGKTCYNNTPTLADSMLIGTYTVSNGGYKIDISKVVSNVKSDYFTIAVKGSARYFELNFEDYTSTTTVNEYSNDVADTVETDRSHMYGFADASKLKPLTTRRGGSLSTRQIKKVEGNMVFSVTASTSGYGWLKFYNSLNDNADTDLTGVTFNYSVKVKLDPSTIEVANASTQKPRVRAGILGSGENNFYQYKDTDSASLLLGKWQTVTGEYTIKSGDIGKKLSSQWDPLKRFSYPMFGMEFVNVGTLVNKKNYVYYLDDISVSESAPSTLASIDHPGAASVSVITSKDVIADTYVSKGNPDTCYGNEDVLKLGDKGGDKKALVLSYMSSAIDGNNYVDLKLNNNGDALKDVHVYYVLDYLADETALTWNTMPEYEKNLLGVYDIAASETQINLSALKDKLTGEYFTLVLRTENHTFYEDFDSYPAGTKFVDGTSGGDNNVADTTDSSKLHYHSFFDTVYNTSQNTVITRRNGDTSERKVISDGENNMLRVVTADGATWGCKLKFYNSVNDSLITKDSDIVGKTLRFTAKVKLDTSATNQSSTSGIKVDIAAYASYTQNALSKVYTANYTALSSDWTTLSVDYTVSADDIMEPLTSSGKTNYSYPIFGLSFNDNDGSASNKYLVDDLTVVEVVDGEAVGDAIFGSREAHSDDISFVSALNDSVTILETTASSATTGDVFSIVDGADTYSLLTVKNGNLVFGDTVLCDEDGNDYVLGDKAVKVAAIYDDNSGTVRFAVGDFLGYYRDGDEVKATFDLDAGVKDLSFNASFGVSGIKASQLDKLTSEIIGTQINELDRSVRFVSGVDAIYYNAAGFLVEKDGSGDVKKAGSPTIYSAVSANDKLVYATEYGYEYMAVLVLKEVKNGGVVKVTPYLRVGANHIYGESMFYKITTNGGLAITETTESEFKAATNAKLDSIKIDGSPIAIFDPEVTEYNAPAADPESFEVEAIPAESDATVTVTQNGNVATITVIGYDGISTKTYTVTAFEAVGAEVVNKNGADGIVTYTFDDGGTHGASIVVELADKYPSLTGSFAIITNKLATLSTIEGDPDDGLLEYEFDENGDYVYTKNESEWNFWADLFAKYGDRGFEGVSHTHTHAYIGEDDNGGSYTYRNTAGDTFTSKVFPKGNVRKEYYASNQILRELGQRAYLMVGAGLTAGGSMIDYTENYKALPKASGAFIGKRKTVNSPTNPEAMVNLVTEFLNEDNRFNIKAYMVQHYATSATAPKSTSAEGYSKEACLNAGVGYWTDYIDKAVEMGEWAAFCFHNVVRDDYGGSSPLTSGHFVFESQADAVFKYTDDLAKENKVWVANFTDACLYMFERSTAELDAYIDGDGNVVVSLNDKENDEIFTMPLTVKVALPTEKTVAKLGETTLNTFTDNGNTYVYVDIIPGNSVTITVE